MIFERTNHVAAISSTKAEYLDRSGWSFIHRGDDLALNEP